MRGGKAEKETKGGERERGRRGKVVVHSTMCVLQPCVEGQKKGGREGWRGRERDGGETRESLKHCLYAGKFWTTLLTSKCFH